jgi:hypothetical protein
MDLEPGPFAVRDEMPLVPPVFTPGRVLGLAADVADAHAAADEGLRQTFGALAGTEDGGLAVPDGGAIAEAANGADAVTPGGDNDALAGAVGSGVAIDEDGALQQTNLPGPDEDEPPSDLDNPIESEPHPPSDDPHPPEPEP